MPTDRVLTVYLLLAVLAIVLLSPILLLPLNGDNSTYQAMAFAMAKGKGLPYLGSWDQNFPAIVFYHWASIKLFGASDLGFRAIDVINRLAITLMLYRLSLRYVDKRIAMSAVPVACFLYLNAGLWGAGQRDGFALTWLLVALLQVTADRIQKREALIFGIAIAIAAFFRPTNLLFGFLLAPALLRKRVDIRTAAVATLSSVLVLIVLLLPWIFAPHGISEFYRATIEFNIGVYTTRHFDTDSLLESLWLPRYFYCAALAGLVIAALKRPLRLYELLMHGVIAMTVIMLQGKFFQYHFEVLAPVTIILCLIALDKASQLLQSYRLLPIAVMLAGGYFFFPSHLVAEFVRRGADANALEQVQRNISSTENYSRQQEQEVTSYLKTHGVLEHTEFLLLFPTLRWSSGATGISRFTTTYCMTMTGAHGLMPYQYRWRKELDSVIAHARPAAIVAAQGPEYLFHLSNISPDSLLRSLPAFRSTIGATYRIDTTIGGFTIYRRND